MCPTSLSPHLCLPYSLDQPHYSGIQVDVSLNNIAATSSTDFITTHLKTQPHLRPLTLLLKQWLFQRKWNEVYTRGGLSSYALFLLVLTIVHQTPLTGVFPEEECLGRWLWEFLRRWSQVDAFTEIIRPLRGGLQKEWRDLYRPYGLCMISV
jgi:DNA polymerase sigma